MVIKNTLTVRHGETLDRDVRQSEGCLVTRQIEIELVYPAISFQAKAEPTSIRCSMMRKTVATAINWKANEQSNLCASIHCKVSRLQLSIVKVIEKASNRAYPLYYRAIWIQIRLSKAWAVCWETCMYGS